MTQVLHLRLTTRFNDRREAGEILARKLHAYADRPDVLVLGVPRGGVPVAYEVARALHVPLDVFVVRKLGLPGHEEFAMGARIAAACRSPMSAVASSLSPASIRPRRSGTNPGAVGNLVRWKEDYLISLTQAIPELGNSARPVSHFHSPLARATALNDEDHPASASLKQSACRNRQHVARFPHRCFHLDPESIPQGCRGIEDVHDDVHSLLIDAERRHAGKC